MATSLVSTGIQFPDGTVQTTAGLTSVIKSIQRGTFTFNRSTNSGNITISAVNVNKSMVIFSADASISQLGMYESQTAVSGTVGGQLTTSTNLSWQGGTGRSDLVRDGTAYWQVIEFY